MNDYLEKLHMALNQKVGLGSIRQVERDNLSAALAAIG